MRRPLNGSPRVSCDHACHLRRNSAGGTDYAVGVGTPVYAPWAGRVTIQTHPRSGYRIGVRGEHGHDFWGFHLSGWAVGNGVHVEEGQVIAYSGGAKGHPGSGDSTGPHLHAHVHDQTRVWGMDEYMAEFGIPTVRHHSLLTLEQALELAGWVGKPYDSREYVLDLQQNAVWRGYLPQSGRDGEYGPQTAAVEKRIWEDEFAPKPTPGPTPDPTEPEPEPEPEVPVEPEPEPEVPVEPEPTPPPLVHPSPPGGIWGMIAAGAAVVVGALVVWFVSFL